ncbi:SDR family oxidoreductase [Actinoallomurus vinaceus]|uniref:SDR family oxidoreductase n=1 Tax=Actinoallomurus vinaceus TaxID=1080074 RepID=A0ABP8UT40_9ACTN
MVKGRIVVTGGAGFLGSHLCERALNDGYGVICVDNLLTGRLANIAHLMAAEEFAFVECDVADYAYHGGDLVAILHFASAASPADYLRVPVETLLTGALGTRRMLEIARERDARFLLASTSEVYGDPQVHPQPESYWGHVNPIGPRSCYDEAKRFAEALTTAYRGVHGTDTAIVRLFNTFGPRMRAHDGRAIPTLISQALAGEPMTVTGDGLQTRSICYVDDLVEGVFRMLWSDHPGPCNLGSTYEISMLDLARLIRDLVGSDAPIVHVGRPTDDPRVRRPDIALAAKILSWEPSVSMVDGLRSTIRWFAAQSASVIGAPTPASGRRP